MVRRPLFCKSSVLCLKHGVLRRYEAVVESLALVNNLVLEEMPQREAGRKRVTCWERGVLRRHEGGLITE